jgi:hypothetical protein
MATPLTDVPASEVPDASRIDGVTGSDRAVAGRAASGGAGADVRVDDASLTAAAFRVRRSDGPPAG